jgi:5-oxoprolinase (ATP-hydrolysing)
MGQADQRWQFWIDRGGTFTDLVGRRPDGLLFTHKLLSENPEHYQDAAIQGMRDLLNLDENQCLAEYVSLVKMGTTVGTNALLERRGNPVGLLITRGFRDCLQIAYQNRPDIFALQIQLPELLYQSVVEIDERINAQGEVLKALDKTAAVAALQTLYAAGIRSLAIVLMHAWRYSQHEQQLAALAEQIGFTQISVSHQISPLMKIVSRGDTTVVDAYLSPILQHYVAQVKQGLYGKHNPITAPQILFMQSNGGLVAAEQFQGKDSILSGPAGGVVGAVAVAEQAGYAKIIAFDMGGTSTDVAHYAGELERQFETQVAGVRMRAPMMHIHTVAAGGGSVLNFDGSRFCVGPESAGANPGPACYRRGGPLTITDANLMLGKLPLFPAVFGADSDLPPDQAKVMQLFKELADNIYRHTGKNRSPEQVAEGFLAVAIENMAEAIKKISVQKGYNITAYTLCCYGAAAGQHACNVADRLGIKQVLLHPFAGVLSAYGMGLADYRRVENQALESSFEETDIMQLRQVIERLDIQGRKAMLAQGVAEANIKTLPTIQIRYQGTDTALAVPFSDKPAMRLNFEQQYKHQFGFNFHRQPLIIEAALVEVIGANQQTDPQAFENTQETTAISLQPLQQSDMFSGDRMYRTPVYHREQLQQSAILKGPAIIVETTATIIIEPGWQGVVNEYMDLILTRVEKLPAQVAIGTTVDPVMLEIFNKLFMSIAEQMGLVLQKTAYSVNIKERLDFSCAIFNAQAQLIANAPHIPVHLGSMGESVEALQNSDELNIKPGDVYLLNSPYHGGTHLPDITVITPVFERSGEQLLFFVASRGHHADIGGITPGSMPSNSHSIEQEGLLSAGLKIVAAGQFLEQVVLQWLQSGKYPARNPQQNIADLKAQIAANEKGRQELLHNVDIYSLATVQAYMRHVQENAAENVRQVLTKLKGGRFVYKLDDDAEIAVSIQINRQQRTASIDFTGTSKQLKSNFNAPAAVCKAAVIYVFRTLVKNDIPLNAGCLEPLQIIIPEGSMLNPLAPAAVVAGNVETSQYIVDALYGALGILAGSQGTMNNFTFGNDQLQYYETICGGAGAGDGFDGCNAIHTHMTNSRMTDPEVIEWRFPVLVDEFSIRKGSGGTGQYQGGDGVRRRIKFLQPMSASILSSHRVYPPFGAKDGQAGKTGVNTLIRKSGYTEELPGCTQIELHAGDSVQIDTPGGGGYGVKKQ